MKERVSVGDKLEMTDVWKRLEEERGPSCWSPIQANDISVAERADHVAESLLLFIYLL